MTDTPQSEPRISRRSIAKGAAWAAPVLIASQGAAAYAASGDRTPNSPKGKACKLFFGTGTMSDQTMDVFLGFDTDKDVIPAGSVVTWTFTMDSSNTYTSSRSRVVPRATDAPKLVYSPKSRWTLTSSHPSGSHVPSGQPVTITFTANTNVPLAEVDCHIKMVWSANDADISPGVVFEMEGLKFKLPRRVSTRFDPNIALKFLTPNADGCYPSVQWSNQGGVSGGQSSNGSSCGEKYKNNTSTLYPNGECKLVKVKSGTQRSIPAYCP